MTAAPAIWSLKPNVTKDEAVRAFTKAGFSSVYWRLRNGPLHRIADAYIPFWLYRVRYPIGRSMHTRLFALDAVNGSLDLLEFPNVPERDQLLAVDTRNRPSAALEPSRAQDLLRGKVLRVIFQQGFFKLRGVTFDIQREPGEIHLPYWVGFHGGPDKLHCRVLDAVRRRMEGAKAAAFFEEWLAA